MSKSSNNSYSYADSEDDKLTANGNFEMDEQEKRVLSANGNIYYNGASIANFSTSMYNGVLMYQLSGATADNTEKAFKALSGVQEQLKAMESKTAAGTGDEATASPATESPDSEDGTAKK